MTAISLLTDFGLRDHYVAAMKGVMLQIAPGVQLVDISHEVAPYQIAEAGYLLGQAWRHFPEGTTHLIVVDPGVGSARRAMVAEAQGHRFVLPDNGLLSLAGVTPERVHEISNPRLMRSPVSRTFHGRDVFAPAAAHLANGTRVEEAGAEIHDRVEMKIPERQVLHVDRFGNIVTSMRAETYGAGMDLKIGGATIRRFCRTYAEAPAGEPFLIEGSGGYVEVSMREGSAAAKLGVKAGDSLG